MSAGAAAAVAVVCTACATRIYPAPDFLGRIEGGVSIVNEQPDVEPRVFFTDGITTLKTTYRGWTSAIAQNLSHRLANIPPPSSKRTLGLTLLSITCSGHYVPTCQGSLFVTTGDGRRVAVSTTESTGYPIGAAMEKFVDNAAEAVLSDATVISYLR